MVMQSCQLSNGLQVRLISDPASRNASALYQIAVGSLHEPDDWPGLAHLLEHVLFAGSAAFQDDQRLMLWMQAQGGRLNATTLGDSTAFFFESPAALLAGGLERLTDMLVAPLLAESAVQQESTAIDAEYRLLAGHQDTLSDAALSAAFAPHPWQRFQVGDRQHFGDDVRTLRAALQQFHRSAYHAGNSILWLQGPQSLAELEQMAQQMGQRFPAVGVSSQPVPPLSLTMVRDFRRQRPDGELLRLSFLLPCGFTPELTVLRQLLLDEAEGSLLAVLRERGQCDGLRVLRPYCSRDQQILSIELTLVAEQYAAAAEGVLQYGLQRLALLNGQQLAHYAALAVDQFRHKSPMDQLRERAFGFAPPEGEIQHWKALLRQLVPATLTRLYSGEKPVTQRKSVQGFDLPLTAQPLSSAILPNDLSELAFFPRPFLPSRVQPCAAAVELPHVNSDNGQAVLLLSPQHVPASWGEILQAAIRSLAGNCAHGGGELSLHNEQGLWLLQLSGSPSLMKTILSSLIERLSALPETLIAQGKREYQRRQDSLRGDIAVRTLIATLPALWQNNTEVPAESTLSQWHWQASLSGGSRELHQQLAQQLTAFPGMINAPHYYRPALPVPRKAYRVTTDSQESAVTLFCPLTVMTEQAVAAWRCLALIYQPAFFQQLRVEQNIGYVASSRFWQVAGHSGILFCLQSPTLDHDALWQGIDAFLQRMSSMLEALGEEQLAEYRQVLLGSLTDQRSDLLTVSREQWRQQQDPAPSLTAAAIERLQVADLLQYHHSLSQQRQHWWRLHNAH